MKEVRKGEGRGREVRKERLLPIPAPKAPKMPFLDP